MTVVSPGVQSSREMQRRGRRKCNGYASVSAAAAGFQRCKLKLLQLQEILRLAPPLMKEQFAASVAEVEAFSLPYLLDEQAAFVAGDAALPAAGCRRRCGTPPPGPLSTSEWPPLAATLARVPRPVGFGKGKNLLSDSQLKAKEVNGVGEMQHGAPAYSQPKAGRRSSIAKHCSATGGSRSGGAEGFTPSWRA